MGAPHESCHLRSLPFSARVGHEADDVVLRGSEAQVSVLFDATQRTCSMRTFNAVDRGWFLEASRSPCSTALVTPTPPQPCGPSIMIQICHAVVALENFPGSAAGSSTVSTCTAVPRERLLSQRKIAARCSIDHGQSAISSHRQLTAY